MLLKGTQKVLFIGLGKNLRGYGNWLYLNHLFIWKSRVRLSESFNPPIVFSGAPTVGKAQESFGVL